jgi:hypothetical protein
LASRAQIATAREIAVFALANRAALHQANNRIESACAGFYARVLREFSAARQ